MNVTRRFFLKSSAAVAAYTALTPARILAEAGLGAGDVRAVRRNKTLVVIFLRGGMDGLNCVVPYADPAYAALRKSLAVPTPGKPGGALDLDGFFGLHPRAAALLPWFQRGSAVALQAVGYDRNTRSHFEEQDTWETGVAGTTIHSDGWLNRHLLTSKGHGPIRAVSIGDQLPRILRGQAPAFAVRGITDLSLFPGKKEAEADTPAQTRLAAALEHAYACCDPRVQAAEAHGARELLRGTAQTTFEGIAELRAVVNQPYQAAAKYPENNELAKRLQQVARLVKAGIGLEVAEIDYGGWDTHQNQGALANGDASGGNYGRLLGGLADALAAFAADLEERLDDVLVVTLSDFGRTAAENGTGGTDHGWANCMLALGGPVFAAGSGRSRSVLGQWPGL
ncbi:MAG: DUF1501 domain-containing protein, partial [Verrucomicrobia bacterium]|nr:DUF1501 domain-containing protein [Verrucomicrobiota bacterium]